jgi:hypothetical protein
LFYGASGTRLSKVFVEKVENSGKKPYIPKDLFSPSLEISEIMLRRCGDGQKKL